MLPGLYAVADAADEAHGDVQRETIAAAFDAVEEGLFASMLSGGLLKDDAFLSLVREEDGEEYAAKKFAEYADRRARFTAPLSAEDYLPFVVLVTYIADNEYQHDERWVPVQIVGD